MEQIQHREALPSARVHVHLAVERREGHEITPLRIDRDRHRATGHDEPEPLHHRGADRVADDRVLAGAGDQEESFGASVAARGSRHPFSVSCCTGFPSPARAMANATCSCSSPPPPP